MQVIEKIEDMRAFTKDAIKSDKKVALVPTMGYLHEGHFSLIKRAKQEADIVVVSIFVNPTQFGENEDLDCYPKDFAMDKLNCEKLGVDAIFAPSSSEMYSKNYSTWVSEDTLSQVLCGKSRPVHFRGVCTVVSKLFNIVTPNVAVFGQKDAQQALIIKRMVRDLNIPVDIIISDLIRDENNLALSSRNKYLSDDHKKDALVLSQSLFAAREALKLVGVSEINSIIEVIKSEIGKSHGVVDYVEALDCENLAVPTENTKEILLALAAKFGDTRLIDNVIVELVNDNIK